MSSESDPDENSASSPSLWPDASLVGVALIWGINIPIMKTGLDDIDGFVFNAIRLTVSAAVLSLLAWREFRSGVVPKPGLKRRSILTFSLIISACYQILFLLGMERTTSGNAALIIATVPMWTALIARICLSERLAPLAWTGLFIALTGTVIVAVQKGNVDVGSHHLLGNLTMLSAALAWSGGTVYSRRLLTLISPLQLSATAAVIALPVHWLISAGRFEGTGQPLSTVNMWLVIAYAGVLSSGLALPMWNFGVRHAGAAHAAVIQNLVPVVAIIVAWLARGENPTSTQFIGGSLIVGGLLTMRMVRQSVPQNDSVAETKAVETKADVVNDKETAKN